MIAKTPGVPRLDKLRVIHIIESDFNLWMGIVCGRQMIAQAESMELFGDEQSGSRPGKRCQDAVILKHMIYSILRLTKSDGITFDNDAKSCFDRIVLPAASIIAQRLGLSKEVIELFITTLSEVEYYAKTYYRLSTMPYKSTPSHGIHGPGQGGRASPAIWTAISCFLLQCMRENSLGANIVSPHGDQFIQVSSGFVYDITHWCIHMDSGHSAADLVEQYLMRHMQDTAQLWEQLLYLTGGKLELSKCVYYPITCSFDSEGAAHLVPPNQLQTTITLEDSESKQSFNIATNPCNEAHKTLGVMEQPDVNNTAKFNRLLKKASNHAQILAGSILKYKETETYYFAIYLPLMS
jgi:Reverse transcriptase (RNA-dependent DNA polymerase)